MMEKDLARSVGMPKTGRPPNALVFLFLVTLQLHPTAAIEYHVELWDSQGRNTKTEDADVRFGLLVVIENPGLESQSFGTVCADGFDVHAADIVCRNLGFHASAGFKANKGFTDFPQLKLLDVKVLYEEIACQVYSRNFNQCNVKKNTICTHSQDVMIECVHSHQIGRRSADGNIYVSLRLDSTTNDPSEDPSYGVLIGTVEISGAEYFHEMEGTVLWDPLEDYRDAELCGVLGYHLRFHAAKPSRADEDFEFAYGYRVLTSLPIRCENSFLCEITGPNVDEDLFEDLFAYSHDHFYDMILICVPEIANKVSTKVVCWEDWAMISCGGLIKILSASYGVPYNDNSCGAVSENGTCSIDVTHLVALDCDERAECTIVASGKMFGNPCNLTSNFLEVSYRCEQVYPTVEVDLETETLAAAVPAEFRDVLLFGILTASTVAEREAGGVVCGTADMAESSIRALGEAACDKSGYNAAYLFVTEVLYGSSFYNVSCFNDGLNYQCNGYSMEYHEGCLNMIALCVASPEKFTHVFHWKFLPTEADNILIKQNEGLLVLENTVIGDANPVYPYFEATTNSHEEEIEEVLGEIFAMRIVHNFCHQFGFDGADDVSLVTLEEDAESTIQCLPIMYYGSLGFDGSGFSVDLSNLENFISNSSQDQSSHCHQNKYIKVTCGGEMAPGRHYSLFPVINFQEYEYKTPVFALSYIDWTDHYFDRGFVCENVFTEEMLEEMCTKNGFDALLEFSSWGQEQKRAYSYLGMLAQTPVLDGQICSDHSENDRLCNESYTDCSVYFVQLISCLDIKNNIEFQLVPVKEVFEIPLSNNWTFVFQGEISFASLSVVPKRHLLVCAGEDIGTATSILCMGSGSYVNAGSIPEFDMLYQAFQSTTVLENSMYIINIKCDASFATRIDECDITFGHCPVEQLLLLECSSDSEENTTSPLSFKFSLHDEFGEPYRGIVNHGYLLATLINKDSGENRTGTVCNDYFTDHTSHVICSEMGFHYSRNIGSTGFGNGYRRRRRDVLTSPNTPIVVEPPTAADDVRRSISTTSSAGRESYAIVLDDIKCPYLNDSSYSLPEFSTCEYSTQHNCGHSEDIFLTCSGLVFKLVGRLEHDNYAHSGYPQAVVFEGEDEHSSWNFIINSISDADLVCVALGFPSAFKYQRVDSEVIEDLTFHDLEGSAERGDCASQSYCAINFIKNFTSSVYHLDCVHEKTGPIGVVDRFGVSSIYNGLLVTKSSESTTELICGPQNFVSTDAADLLCGGLGFQISNVMKAIDTSTDNSFREIIADFQARGKFAAVFCDTEGRFCRFQITQNSTCPCAYYLECSPDYDATGMSLYWGDEEVANNGIVFASVNTGSESEKIISRIPVCSVPILEGGKSVIDMFCEWLGFYGSDNQYEVVTQGMSEEQIWIFVSDCQEHGECRIGYFAECEGGGALMLHCFDPQPEFTFWTSEAEDVTPALSGILEVKFVDRGSGIVSSGIVCNDSLSEDLMTMTCKSMGFNRGFSEVSIKKVTDFPEIDWVTVSVRCSEESGKEICGYDIQYSDSPFDSCSAVVVSCSNNFQDVIVRSKSKYLETAWLISMVPILSYKILGVNDEVTDSLSGGVMLKDLDDHTTVHALCNELSGFGEGLIHSSAVYHYDDTFNDDVVAFEYECPEDDASLESCEFESPSEVETKSFGDETISKTPVRISCVDRYEEFRLVNSKGEALIDGQEPEWGFVKIISNHNFEGKYIGDEQNLAIIGNDESDVDSFKSLADVICKSLGFSDSKKHVFATIESETDYSFDYCSNTFACSSTADITNLAECSTAFAGCGEWFNGEEGSYNFLHILCQYKRRNLKMSYTLRNEERELEGYYGILFGAYRMDGESRFGTICGKNFNSSTGEIVCKEMGYDYFDYFALNEGLIHFNDGKDFDDTKIVVDEVRCHENNSTCDYLVKEPSGCHHTEDVLLRCGYNDDDHSLQFHFLSGGDVKSTADFSMDSGLLVAELRWTNSTGHVKAREGLVCDDSFDDQTADSICRYMGFHRVVKYSNNRNEPFLNDAELSDKYTFLLDELSCVPGVDVSCEYDYKSHDCKAEEAINLWCGYAAELCDEVDVNGYLRIACKHPDDPSKLVYRCPQEDLYYRVLESSCHSTRYSDYCRNDPSFYQVCGHRPLDCEDEGITLSSNISCSSYVCKARFEIKSGNAIILSTRCNENFDCENTQIDEQICDGTSDEDDRLCYNSDGVHYTAAEECNKKCDCAWCDDESFCNDHHYGTKCRHPLAHFHESGDGNFVSRTIPPNWICDGSFDCVDGEDEQNCSEGDTDSNSPSELGVCRSASDYSMSIQLNSLNKCSVESDLFGTVCANDQFYSQYNCADEDLEVLKCSFTGESVTVSSHYVCTDRSSTAEQLCDDEIDKACDIPESNCVIHKHQNCDGINDCTGEADEKRMLCKKMTSRVTCVRKYVGNGGESRNIPYSWVFDGVVDCIDGSDEDYSNFPLGCGNGNERRQVELGKNCGDLDLASFKCFASNTFIDLSYVCDRIESCGNENRICEVSRNVAVVFSKVLEGRNKVKQLSYCLPGLTDLTFLRGGCIEEQFDHPFPLLGINQELIHRPVVGGIDCRSVFGELYVYLSCSGLCVNTSCPLQLLGDAASCSNIVDPRMTPVMALTPDLLTTSKAFMWSGKGQSDLKNNLFRCNNGLCVEYSQVCNLVDDCGDESDEDICDNHFQCNNGDFIPRASKCDQRTDCLDLSDECNEECTKDIVDQIYLIIVSWAIGILACLANFVIIAKSIYEFKSIKTAAAMMNKILIFFISIGDFLMGVYLVIIGFISTKYRLSSDRSEYCQAEFVWLTSWGCATLGVMSSFGSEVSLISMTVLSISRLLGIRSVFAPRHLSVKVRLKLSGMVLFIVTLSVLIAVLPLFDIFEDFFVNGLFYKDVPLFIGAPDIEKHLLILGEYFNIRIWPARWYSWDSIRPLVREMFSSYSNIVGKKQHFYGNDGVCLFKFFADKDDPQSTFIWAILGFNFVCFVIITVSYIFIHFFSAQSTKSVSSNAGNKEMQKRNQKLQRKISLIILTDFCCWIPLILICILHFTEVFELSSLYPFFSTMILPINSVINPLLYDSTVTDLVLKAYLWIRRLLGGKESTETVNCTSTMVMSNKSLGETIPMQPLPDSASERQTPMPPTLRKRITGGIRLPQNFNVLNSITVKKNSVAKDETQVSEAKVEESDSIEKTVQFSEQVKTVSDLESMDSRIKEKNHCVKDE